MVYNALIDKMCNFKIRRKNGRITGRHILPSFGGGFPQNHLSKHSDFPRCCQALALKEMGDLEQARRGYPTIHRSGEPWSFESLL